MRLYKYTNRISEYNVLEVVLIADNITEAIREAKRINSHLNWGNHKDEQVSEVVVKPGVILINNERD
jgi:hypothetical protein